MSTPTARAMDSTEKVNILLVDDQPGKLLAHETVLNDLGENVVKAASGREALEFLLKTEFAVILLDVNMPDMDGFETAEIIRQRPCLERIPIIFVTGYNTSDLDRLKGYNIGAVDYLFLPIVPEVLKAKVQVFVDLAKQKQIIRRQAEYLTLQTKKQEEQIRLIQALNEQLKVANDELESFSYTISHDLRSPLRALEGYSYLLMEEHSAQIKDEALHYLKRINKSALRMDQLIRDILAYSRISKSDIPIQTVDLNELIRDIIEQDLNFQNLKGCMEIRQPLHPVLGHPSCLAQCIWNLLENAAKFVPPQVPPQIRVNSRLADRWVRLCIEDNGIGIDPAFRGRIFRIFERAHQGSHYDGTGIGLAIVKKGVERMGGRVGFDSEVGRGSRFWIELPAAD